jgi:transcriptional regulator with XRE-family HTH domain
MAILREKETQEFGRQVRARRESLTLSQEALAAAAFGNPDRKTYISALENGRRAGVTPATAKKLARVLEIPVEDVPPGLRWREGGYASPLEDRLATLEDRVAAQDPAQETEEALVRVFNAQLARQLDEPVSDVYFRRLGRGLRTLGHWTGGPFSLRSLAISFTFAFVYVVFAGLLALGHGRQAIGEVAPFVAPGWATGGLAWIAALGVIAFLLSAGVICVQLLRDVGTPGVSWPTHGLRLGLAALLAAVACTVVALITKEPVAVAVFFAVLCFWAVANLPPRSAMLAGLGGGLISGTSAGIMATGSDLTTIEASVIGATIGGGAGLASSLMARTAPCRASGQLAGAGAGVAVGAILVCGGLIMAQELAGTGTRSAGLVAVMWLALPFANALTDYLSLGASHWLGRRLVTSGKSVRFALTLGLLDLVLAVVLMLLTVKVIGAGLALTDRAFTGDIDGTGFLAASLADLWGTGLWLGLMVLSTIAWTYGHFAAFVAPAFAGWLTFRVLEAPAAARLASLEPRGAIDMGTALALPGRHVFFWVAWLALAALPPVLFLLGEGLLQSILVFAL